jgi:dolichyl-phosphate beta-glucosyltransferase
MHLSIIVPAFNEEKIISENINKYNNYLKAQDYSYEIIIINDGSRDQTKKIIQKICENNKNIKFINLDKNYGKGYAVKKGMLLAKGNYRLFLDTDNSTSINHIEKALPLIQKNEDIIIGSRNPCDTKKANIISYQSFWKIILGKTGNLLIRGLFKIKIHDTQCGFKIFSKEATEKIFPKLKINRWLFDLEALILAQKYNYRINIIPVEWINSKESKVGLKGYFISLSELIKIKYNLVFNKYNIN